MSLLVIHAGFKIDEEVQLRNGVIPHGSRNEMIATLNKILFSTVPRPLCSSIYTWYETAVPGDMLECPDYPVFFVVLADDVAHEQSVLRVTVEKVERVGVNRKGTKGRHTQRPETKKKKRKISEL